MDSALLEALAGAVRELHPSNLDRLETRLMEATASPQSVTALAIDLPQRSQREALSRLATCWKVSSHSVSPLAIATASQALRYAAKHQTRAEVCWSGPVNTLQGFRTTAEAYRELISKATRTALIVSYALGEVESLRDSLEIALSRGVQVRLLLEDFHVFTQTSWRSQFVALGSQVLEQAKVYIWPKSNRRQNDGRVYGSMHIKCLVVDEEAVLLTSANWSGAAMQDNMELGVVVADLELASSVAQHFDHLITNGVIVPVT